MKWNVVSQTALWPQGFPRGQFWHCLTSFGSFLSVFEMTWQAFTLEMVGHCRTALGCFGLNSSMVDDFEDRRKVPNRWRIAGWMLQISGLLVMWLGALPCLVQITWQVAVCSLPDMCVFLFFAFLACRVPRDIDVLGFIFFEFFLLNFMALPLSGLWQCFTGHIRSGAYFFVNGSGLRIFRICPWSCSVLWFALFPLALLLWRRRHLATWSVHCWPWAFFVPFGLLSIYCAVEGFILFWNSMENWTHPHLEVKRRQLQNTRRATFGCPTCSLNLSWLRRWHSWCWSAVVQAASGAEMEQTARAWWKWSPWRFFKVSPFRHHAMHDTTTCHAWRGVDVSFL